MRWAFYDRDNDGKFDLVLFSPSRASSPTYGFEVAGGRLKAVDAGPKMVQWGRMTDDKLREEFAKVAAEVFGDDASE